MPKEIKTFEFNDLKFERKSDGKIIEFGIKQVQIEIEWQGNQGKGEKEIVLEKDDKKYRLTVRIELVKKMWRDIKKSSSFITPRDADYDYYFRPPAHQTAEGKWELDSERVDEISLLHPWKTGRIVGAGIFVLVVIGIIGFIFWLNKRKDNKT